ncbi:hypothetical protein ALP75_202682 [Pseudomonas syringae pv. actinidiae]|nr:hypothetical protein ALP75_202682 [Pseudomonas syringae pv. actinidiae]
MDHVDHAVDLLAVFGHALDHFRRLLHTAGKPGNRHLYAIDNALAGDRQRVGGLRLIAGGRGVLGDVMDSGGHFVDRGGHLIGFTLLAEHALTYILHARGQMRGALIETAGGLRNGVDHPLVSGLHGVEGLGHLPHLVVTAVGHTG